MHFALQVLKPLILPSLSEQESLEPTRSSAALATAEAPDSPGTWPSAVRLQLIWALPDQAVILGRCGCISGWRGAATSAVAALRRGERLADRALTARMAGIAREYAASKCSSKLPAG